MALTSWLKLIERNRRRHRTAAQVAAEILENRSLLSVAALFVNGELFVGSDGGDSITIRQNTNARVEVLANGVVLGTAPNVLTSAVTKIVVKGGDEANVIDLNAVTNSTYPNLTSILIDSDDGADVITGSPTFGDSVLAGDGNDIVLGQGGNDTLDGGDGDDSLTGSDGDDNLIGEDGSDSLSGDVGNDTLSGGDHSDTLSGGDGNDVVDAGLSSDLVNGDNGNDTLNGMDGADTLSGDAGDDLFFGGAGTDFLLGGDGDDTVDAQAGNDTVLGEAGDDSLAGGTGSDSVAGGVGQDFLNGGADDDTVVGGEDLDTLLGGAGNDRLFGDEVTPQAASVGNDVLSGQSGNDTLEGGGGNDQLDGGAGNDLLQPNTIDLSASALLLSIDDATVTEGDAGITTVMVTVRLSQSSVDPVTVDYSTQDDTALVGADFQAVSGTLIFAAGQTTRTITVLVRGEVLDEADERFLVGLSNVQGATVGDGQATVTILDNDVSGNLPRINVSDVTVTPERDGPAIVFVLDVSASVGNIFSGTPVGDLNNDLIFNTVLDAEIDALIRLNNRLIADGLGDAAAIAIETTRNNNGRRIEMNPTGPLSTFSTTLALTPNTENPSDGNSSLDVEDVLRKLIVQVNPISGLRLLEAAAQTFQTLGVSAASGRGGLLVFLSDGFINPADPTDLATLQGLGVTIRAFAVGTSTNLATMQTFDPSAIAITSSDQLQQQIGAIPVPTSDATVTVSLSQPSLLPVSVTVGLANGSATVGPDYLSLAGSSTITFTPGTTTQSVTVSVQREQLDEPDENFFVNLSAPINATVGDSQGQVTIVDDDGAAIAAPTLTISDVTMAEGNAGATNFVFDVTLTRPVGNNSAVTVQYMTEDDSATSGGANPDYVGTPIPVTLTFAAGVTSQQFTIRVNGDLIAGGDPDEAFVVNLLNPSVGAILTDSRAVGLIQDDDGGVPTPLVLVDDVLIDEINSGVVSAVVTVTLSSPAAAAVSINLSTADGSARAGSDYSATTTTINIPIGGTSGSASIPILGDTRDELAEFFTVNLLSASGGLLTASSLQVTIRDDDGVTFSSPNDCLLIGGDGNDTANGGLGNDTLNGGLGADAINGGSGNDSILGGAGADTINGEAGNNTINGQAGTDQINSGHGDDLLVWEGDGSGNDTLDNASGFDTVQVNLDNSSETVAIGQTAIPLAGTFGFMQITEGAATVTVLPSLTNIEVNANGGNDTVTIGDLETINRSVLTVRGGDGNDVLTAIGANVGTVRLRLEGGDGDDTLIGGRGNDTLIGEAGIDRLRGGDGNDVAFGGVSIDSISGENGNDTLFGGDGTETNLADGADTLEGGAGNDSLRGEFGNDSIFGGDGDDTSRGGDGNDSMTGELGNDSLLGDTGNDTLNGGDGHDTLDGGRSNDLLNGMSGNDKLRGDHGDDTILGGAGIDTLNGGDGNDNVSGQSGADLMTGADGDDFVNGADGNDTITGGDGDDTLLGGDGNDVILGEQGDDSINGQASTDTLTGGQGDDTLVGAVLGEINESFVLSADFLTALNAL